jgi:hypothetical protein
LHLQLVKHLAAALGGAVEAVSVVPGDQQLQMRDHRLGGRGACLEFAPRRPLGMHRQLQRVDVIGKHVGRIAHAENRITSGRGHARRIFSPKQEIPPHPASSGRQVRSGCRQSIPSSM